MLMIVFYLQLVSSPDMSSEGSDVDCYVRDPDYDPKYYESTPSDVVENVDTDFDTDEPKSTSTILAEEDQGGDQDDDPDFNKEEDQKEGQEEDQDDGYEEDQDEDQEEDQKDDQDDDWEEGQDDDQEEAHEEDQDGDHEEDQDDDHEEDQDDDDQEEDPLKGKFTIRKKKNLRTYVKGQNKKTKTTKTEVSVNVTVKTCTKRKDNKRSWDKKHYCLYCHQPNNKMARHLQRKHMEVKDVAHAFSFASKSPQRKVLLEQIRRKGDFKHNVRVLAEGKGQIVTVKQPSHKTSAWHYLPCKFCYGMFSRTDLWRHQGSCKLKTSSETDNKRKTRGAVQSVSARLLPIMASSSGCQAIINKMRQDDVSFHIRGDSLICNYGESLYAKHGRVKSKHNYISQRMRELGRFMLTAKAMDSTVRTLEDICVPKKFLLVVNAAKKLTEFSPSKNEYGKPSTAVRVGFCLKGAVEVLIGQSLMNDDDLAEKKAKKFLELLEKNWKTHVAVSAHQSMQEKRWNKPDDIPLTKNVMALRDHLRMVEDKARAELEQQLSLTAYKVLNESILAQLIVFNKRHEGEASRLTLEAYKKVNTNPINEDIYSTLSPLEKELSKQLTRIEVRGKRGKKVPVFFTHRMMESIQVLLKWRDEAGVPTENPYLFARAGVLTNIRGCDCLRKYAEESKAENPELLRSTKLRKQVATLCQLLDLDEQELEQVARFMGHDIRVHRDFYRQTDKTFQIAKISKLLFAMEQGSSTLTGMHFNTLHPSVSGMYVHTLLFLCTHHVVV
ncbi:nucleoporin p54 isoform X1 [Solea senegalensis]|uniref:Nucleoporin p54 isoform X1 n=1 Tax=Solea senegalensis TaxID=28829 RepID=A0AAV6PFD7_SOLSE|nr:nucleoporin p54 isoform X1 [Solea senegalensis]